MMSNLGNTIAGTYAFSAVAGGLGSKLTGGDFWQGAGISLMTADPNHGAGVVTTEILAKIYHRVRYQVMDPGAARYRTIGQNSMRFIIRVNPK